MTFVSFSILGPREWSWKEDWKWQSLQGWSPSHRQAGRSERCSWVSLGTKMSGCSSWTAGSGPPASRHCQPQPPSRSRCLARALGSFWEQWHPAITYAQNWASMSSCHYFSLQVMSVCACVCLLMTTSIPQLLIFMHNSPYSQMTFHSFWGSSQPPQSACEVTCVGGLSQFLAITLFSSVTASPSWLLAFIIGTGHFLPSSLYMRFDSVLYKCDMYIYMYIPFQICL